MGKSIDKSLSVGGLTVSFTSLKPVKGSKFDYIIFKNDLPVGSVRFKTFEVSKYESDYSISFYFKPIF